MRANVLEVRPTAFAERPAGLNAADQPLLSLGRELLAQRYRFTTGTPLTHARVNRRSENRVAQSIVDVFGWSRPFRREDFPRTAELLAAAGELKTDGELLRSGVRFSSLGEMLFLHSAFPTDEADSVFFGPDTYRFVRALKQQLSADAIRNACVVDVGCGSGAGGIALAASVGNTHRELILSDISAKALRFAKINVALNNVPRVTVRHSDILADVGGKPDIIIANPPYMVDPAARLYRDGGGALGFDLSLRIARDSLARLPRGGRLILYTGAPIVRGADRFREALAPVLDSARCTFTYEEIDPDVFGEELERDNYRDVERIAVVVLALSCEG